MYIHNSRDLNYFCIYIIQRHQHTCQNLEIDIGLYMKKYNISTCVEQIDTLYIFQQ
nr:MAG TPA: hypothetical protein [Caudoviricetes sp.]